jgi:hypothetical protein
VPWAPTFASGPVLRSEEGGRPRRDFRGRRLIVNLMRALHLVALAGFAAAVLAAGPHGWRWAILLLASGAVMMTLDAWSDPGYLRQVQGVAMLVKLALVATMIMWRDGQQALFWLLVFGSALLSHAPGRVRHHRVF